MYHGLRANSYQKVFKALKGQAGAYFFGMFFSFFVCLISPFQDQVNGGYTFWFGAFWGTLVFLIWTMFVKSWIRVTKQLKERNISLKSY